ncbi:prohibitin family protein [Fulvivirga sp. M361]|uniref:prohibitin family protein n=1 Tax=Fulvivirga sp. M361 TaxID=2594266 RepID=UPI00117A9A82|nr:prohibitin family protein [Fulvivirga sp. M361]TRX52651.1 prohibitin family protein [Fulvivirga sp. M361]
MDNRKYLPLIIIAAVALMVVFGLSSSIFYTVESGERAVIFKKFGGGLDKENVIGQGFNFKAPWNSLYVYDVKENTAEEKMDVLDKNGLSISVDVTVRFHPIYDQIGFLHENFGTNYINKLVIPEVRSAVRQVMGRFTAEEIYSTKRAEVESGIKMETEKTLDMNNIQMKALLIRSINLPDQIKSAIENKLKQEQEALAYEFRLDREKSEAERKRIAASGEAAANDIVNSSLTENLLKMRGIEATLELSKSPNSKVVIVGSGKDGMPLILGNN